MEVKFAVKRYDPITNAKSSTQTYSAEVGEGDTVLDALLQVRDEQDPTLAFRGSCRTGFCGDCTMTVNGKGAITCRTKVAKAWKGAEDGAIELEALKMSKPVKDLVYNAREFHWDKFKAVEPWVDPVPPPPEGEHLVPGGHGKHLTEAMRCTQCGLCDQGCTVLVVDKTFRGAGGFDEGLPRRCRRAGQPEASTAGQAEPRTRDVGLHPLLRGQRALSEVH